MILKRTGRAQASATVVVGLSVSLLAGCASLADRVDAMSNGTGEPKSVATDPRAIEAHSRLLVADLHADTLLWRRGLTQSVARGHMDLKRMVAGNIGLQVFTIPTRVPVGLSCISGGNYDPAPLLARLNGWPSQTWGSAHQRALHQADSLLQVATKHSAGSPTIRIIRTLDDLRDWHAARFPKDGRQDVNVIGAILGVEGAHAFDDVGGEFEALYERGLRMVAPTHRFDNDYGGSSEGCDRGGLQDKGVRLIKTAIERGMIVDLAHVSSAGLRQGLELAGARRHPVVISHSGLQSYLKQLGHKHADRANTNEELVLVAQTGGVFGVGFWPEVVGEARVKNVVDTIVTALHALRQVEGSTPAAPGFHVVRRASQHIGLGSDWDGAVKTAIDAGQVALITQGLLQAGVSNQEIEDIMGRNVCRVVAQSLGRGALTFDGAISMCRPQ